MPWLYLFIAGIFEIVWAVGLKFSHGFTRLSPSLITAAGMLASFIFLAKALKVLPIGTAYAVWTGIGAVGTATLGMILFKESTEPLRIFFILLIVIGIMGLRLASPD